MNFQGVGLFSLSFPSPTVNDIRRKLYMVRTYSTVENEQKECQMLQSRPLHFLFIFGGGACYVKTSKGK